MKKTLFLGAASAVALLGVITAFQDKLIYMQRNYESHGLRNYYHNLKKQFEDRSGRLLLEVSYNTSAGEQTAFWIPPTSKVIEEKSFEKLWIVEGITQPVDVGVMQGMEQLLHLVFSWSRLHVRIQDAENLDASRPDVAIRRVSPHKR